MLVLSPKRKSSILHKQKKFIIWLSIFLSLLLLAVSSLSVDAKEETSRTVDEVPKAQSHPNPWAVSDGLKLIQAQNANRWYEYVATHPPPAPPTTQHKVAVAPSPQQEQPPPDTTNASDVEQVIYSYFGSGSLGHSARNVADCESGLDPSSISRGGGNYGLFQINTAHNSPDASDPNSFQAVTGLPWSATLQAGPNTQYAKYLYDHNGGWSPWSCRWAA